MNKFLISLCLLIILSPCGQSLPAAPVPYSGKVAINGLNFQGDAPFTFALRDANGAVHWRNGDKSEASRGGSNDYWAVKIDADGNK